MNRRDWLLGAASVLVGSRAKALLDGPAGPPPVDGNPGLSAKNDFTIEPGLTYLNSASQHPLSIRAIRGATEFMEGAAKRPKNWRESVEAMDREVLDLFAGLIGAKPAEVCYVPSTMTGENLALASLRIPASGGNVVTDVLHYLGSIYLYRELERQGLELRVVEARDGRIEPEDLAKAIDGRTRLVALALVSNVNGFQHDLKTVCELAHRRGAHVYADIIQAAGAVPIDVRESGVDFCACSAYKWLMAEHGLGFLYVREDLLGKIARRSQYGWKQLDRSWPEPPPEFRPRSEDAWHRIAGAPGYFHVGAYANVLVGCLRHSLKYLRQLGVEKIHAHAQTLTQRLQAELPRLGYAPMTPSKGASGHIVSFKAGDIPAVRAKLEKAGVEVNLRETFMRISVSVFNDEEDIDRLIEALA